MSKWLAKRIYVDGDITDYEVKYKTDSNQRPSAHYDILLGPDIPREYAIASKDLNGEWGVVADQTKRTQHETRITNKQDAIDALKSLDWANITTVAKTKQVLRHIVRILDME
jgi:hypothetical protein